MKIRLLSLLAIPVFCLSAAFAQEPAASESPQHAKPSASPKAGVYDYQDLPINDVLRDLSRAAKVNLIIGNGVSGNLTFHTEGKTPLQVIEAIAEYRSLLFREMDNTYYVVSVDDWRELMRGRYFFEAPELPVALAKYEKRYFDALLKEGFSREEALKIITSQSLPPRDNRFNY